MSSEFSRILIVKPSSLGDVVHTLPVVHALKRCYPECSIGWIIQQGLVSLLACDPAVATVYPVHIPSTSDPQAGRGAYLRAFRATLTALRGLRNQFAANPYDLVLDLHASFRSGLLGRCNPGGTRIGFADARELNTLFQNQRIEIPDGLEHALEKNLLFAAHLGCKIEQEDFFISCAHGDREAVRDLLTGMGIEEEELVVYAGACARWRSKFWPASSWAQLADRLHAEGVHLVFGGSAADERFIDAIGAEMCTPPLVVAGRLSLTRTVALLQRSALYVGVDTGPMHMAALAGLPVVAMFGPTHPERVGPYGVEHHILRAEGLDCLGCRKRDCTQLSCMRGIEVGQVLNAVMAGVGKNIAGIGKEDS